MKNKIIFGMLLLNIIISGCGSDGTTGTVSYGTTDTSSTEGDFVKILLSDISDTAKFYSQEYNGKQVNYFVVKGTDGEIRTAFDACDICGGSKGYRQSGTDMICNNCGKVFRIDDIGTKNLGGGCWPSYLSHEIEGDYLLISVSEIEQGLFRF